MYFKDDTVQNQFNLIAQDFGIGKGEGEPYDVASGGDAIKTRFIHYIKSNNKPKAIMTYQKCLSVVRKLKKKGDENNYKTKMPLILFMRDSLIKKGWAKEKEESNNTEIINMTGDANNANDVIQSTTKESKFIGFDVKGFLARYKKPIAITALIGFAYLGYRYFNK